MVPINRRTLLRLAGTASIAATAGCLGNPPGESANNDTDDDVSLSPTPTADQIDAIADADSDVEDPATWRIDVGNASTTRPLVENGIVFAGGDAGDVVAVTEEGGVLWRYSADVPINGPLAVLGPWLIVVAGGSPLESSNSVVHGIDIASGEGGWTADSLTGKGLALVAAADDEVYVVSNDDAVGPTGETMYALDVTTGDERWTAEVGSPYFTAAVDEDGVYLRSADRLYAIDRDDGGERWHWDSQRATPSRPRVKDSVVFFGSLTPENTSLIGFDTADGTERWRLEEWGVTSLTIGSDAVYAGNGKLGALDPQSGESLWETSGPSFLSGGPIVGETIYAGGDTVAGYDTTTGEQRFVFDPDRELVVARDASEEILAVDTTVGNERGKVELFGVDPDSGDPRWTFDRNVKLTDSRVGERSVYVGTEDGYLYAIGR